jgi:hypothetical protein
MIGGTNKTTGIALGAAIAGVALGGSFSASAADLAGGGYADLEERIAELEATSARKGNRKVSLEISGFVNEAIFAWDDGVESNAYVTTNEINPTRVRFKGDAEITKGWKAGYLIELGVNGGRQDRQNQNEDNGTTGTNTVAVRHSAWYLSSKDYGRVWVGQTSDAADGVLEVNVANTGHFASSNISQSFGDGGGGFFLRGKDGTLFDGLNGNPTVNFGDLVVNGWGGTPDSHRYNLVKYETPTIAGFIGSASWGEDDIWNLALRYSGEFGGFKLAAGLAFSHYNDGTGQRRGALSSVPGASDVDVDEFGVGASIIHTATGLFLTGSYGQDEDNNAKTAVGASAAQLALADDTTNYYFIQGGIERKFFPLGLTTIYGEYFSLERGLALGTGGGALDVDGLGTAGFDAIVASELSGFGFGINQNLNSVVDLYVSYRHIEPEATLATVAGATEKAALEDFDYVTAGAYIKF